MKFKEYHDNKYALANLMKESGQYIDKVVECHQYDVRFTGNLFIQAELLDLTGVGKFYVDGDLTIWNATLKWDPNLKIHVTGNVCINNTGFGADFDDPSVSDEERFLPTLYSGGDVDLQGSSFRIIEDLTCCGDFSPNKSITEVRRLECRGNCYFNYTYSLKKLPDHFVVGGNLEMTKVWKLKEFPKTLYVKGDMKISWSSGDFMEEGKLLVVGDLNVYRSEVSKLPHKTTIGGKVFLYESHLEGFLKNNTVNIYNE